MKVLMEKSLSKARGLNARYPLADIVKVRHLNFEEWSAIKEKLWPKKLMVEAQNGGDAIVSNHAQYIHFSFYLIGELFAMASEKSGISVREAREFCNAMRAPLFQPLPFDMENLEPCLQGMPALQKNGKFAEKFGESLRGFRLALFQMEVAEYCAEIQPNHVRLHSANLIEKIYEKVAGAA